MKTEVTAYHLQVRGIFGRNRKAKFETFLLIETPKGQTIGDDELKSLATAKIIVVKVKSGKVKVTKTHVTIEQANGMTYRAMEIALGVDNTVLDLGEI